MRVRKIVNKTPLRTLNSRSTCQKLKKERNRKGEKSDYCKPEVERRGEKSIQTINGKTRRGRIKKKNLAQSV